MPLYMDMHTIDGGVTLDDVAEAHRRDVEVQGKHGVDYKAYWVDESSGKVFCLVEAPNPDAARQVHAEAHGLLADDIWEVKEGA